MTKNNIPSEWMTLEEVADRLKLSRSKIYDMAQRGEIPCSKVVGRWRFFLAEVNEWMLQQRPARAGARGRGTPMNDRSTKPRVKVSVDTYRDDKLYSRVTRTVDKLLTRGKVVAPVDVLIDMGLLEPKRLEDWRRGRVPYLEKVIGCNLTRVSRLLRILRFHAHDLKLKPSVTTYMRWGKGPKQHVRFTKTGDPKLEEAYARHFVWPGKEPFHPPASKNRPARGVDHEQELELGLAKETDA